MTRKTPRKAIKPPTEKPSPSAPTSDQLRSLINWWGSVAIIASELRNSVERMAITLEKRPDLCQLMNKDAVVRLCSELDHSCNQIFHSAPRVTQFDETPSE